MKRAWQNCFTQMKKAFVLIALKVKRVWDEALLCDWKMYIWNTHSICTISCESTLLNGWISVLLAFFVYTPFQWIESILYFKVYFKEQTRAKQKVDSILKIAETLMHFVAEVKKCNLFDRVKVKVSSAFGTRRCAGNVHDFWVL